MGNERAHAYRMVAWLFFGQIKKSPGNIRCNILSVAQTFTSHVPERLLSTIIDNSFPLENSGCPLQTKCVHLN